MDVVADVVLAISVPLAVFTIPLINLFICYFLKHKTPKFHKWMVQTIGIQNPLKVKREVNFNYERK